MQACWVLFARLSGEKVLRRDTTDDAGVTALYKTSIGAQTNTTYGEKAGS